MPQCSELKKLPVCLFVCSSLGLTFSTWKCLSSPPPSSFVFDTMSRLYRLPIYVVCIWYDEICQFYHRDGILDYPRYCYDIESSGPGSSKAFPANFKSNTPLSGAVIWWTLFTARIVCVGYDGWFFHPGRYQAVLVFLCVWFPYFKFPISRILVHSFLFPISHLCWYDEAKSSCLYTIRRGRASR